MHNKRMGFHGKIAAVCFPIVDHVMILLVISCFQIFLQAVHLPFTFICHFLQQLTVQLPHKNGDSVESVSIILSSKINNNSFLHNHFSQLLLGILSYGKEIIYMQFFCFHISFKHQIVFFFNQDSLQ